MGRRLRPYTVVLPKPLMPLGDFPILEIIIRQLANSGFDRVTLAVNHQADIIKSYFGTGDKWGIRIDYSLERKPLGTMGPLKLIQDLPEHFLVMNGDVLTDLDFGDFYTRHLNNGNFFSISSFKRCEQSEYGVLDVNDGRKLTGFREKPVHEYEVSMGVYMLSKEVLGLIPDDTPFGFDELMYTMIESGKPVAVIRHEGCWMDIGRPDDYEQAIDKFEEDKKLFLSD
jgi:NDP-sugar pyrophosphorylase family protein